MVRGLLGFLLVSSMTMGPTYQVWGEPVHGWGSPRGGLNGVTSGLEQDGRQQSPIFFKDDSWLCFDRFLFSRDDCASARKSQTGVTHSSQARASQMPTRLYAPA